MELSIDQHSNFKNASLNGEPVFAVSRTMYASLLEQTCDMFFRYFNEYAYRALTLNNRSILATIMDTTLKEAPITPVTGL